MMSRAGLLLAFSASLVALAAACDPGGTGTAAPQNIEEVGEDCQSCLVDLAECASTAMTPQQFIECRDLFGGCQREADLEADECGRPSARLACGLCQDRYAECDGEGGDCDDEFGSCRDLLVGGSGACEPRQEDDAEASCDDCLRELAACASSDEASVCQNGFVQCRDTNGLDSCENPTDSQACELCDAQRDTCAAQADEAECAAKRDACLGQLASNPAACPAEEPSGSSTGSGEGGSSGTGEGGSSGTGEGGSSGTGEGGSTGTGDTTTGGGTCEFDGCAVNEAPEVECNACTAEVCGADAFCCEGSWDETCVGLAEIADNCGCSADTCSHDACETGPALTSDCNECATAVCAQDDFCCTVEWDFTCTELAAATCGCGV